MPVIPQAHRHIANGLSRIEPYFELLSVVHHFQLQFGLHIIHGAGDPAQIVYGCLRRRNWCRRNFLSGSWRRLLFDLFQLQIFAHLFCSRPTDSKEFSGKWKVEKMIGAVERKGMTLIPLSVYFNGRGRAKVELALAKGKQAHDKRQTMKERDWKRDQQRIMREHK